MDTDSQPDSQIPDLYQDGTVPADADLVTPSEGSAGMEEGESEGAGPAKDRASKPDAGDSRAATKLVEGNRVTTATDME